MTRSPVAGRVAVVTDSSANLPPGVAADRGIVVVPLRVVIGGMQYLEGEEVDAQHLTEALRAKVRVTTSRPSPQAFVAAYRRLADEGASAVVSIHLSAEVSGTYEAALLAAREATIPVRVVDSRTLGLALGFAVRAAADSAGGAIAADAEETAEKAATAALARAASSSSLFYVDDLDYLRRGGRVSATRAFFGSALAVKPILHVTDGRIELLEKVRTGSKARARLLDLAVERALAQPSGVTVDVAVQHLAAAARAQELADDLRGRVDSVGELVVQEVGAAVGAHVGPGMVAAIVAPQS